MSMTSSLRQGAPLPARSRARFPLLALMALLAGGAVLPAAAPAAVLSGTVAIADPAGPRSDRKNVVVWLEGPGAKTVKRPAGAKPQMRSESKKFQPGVLVVPVGSEVNFPNVDPIFHNVFSVSGENRFDLGLYKSGASKAATFKKAGVVKVYCNIHSGMVGFVVVVDTPLWAVSDASGSFSIPNVPPGTYTLKWWEEKAGEKSREIVVTENGPSLSLEVDARGFTAKPHLNKYGKPYEKKAGDDERY